MPGYKYRLRDKRLACSTVESDLVILLDGKFIMNHECSLVAKRANCILGCFKHSTENGSKEAVVLLNLSIAVASAGVFCTVLGSTI